MQGRDISRKADQVRKSAEVIVVTGKEPNLKENGHLGGLTRLRRKGLNDELLKIR
jgi:hypothetical protein